MKIFESSEDISAIKLSGIQELSDKKKQEKRRPS